MASQAETAFAFLETTDVPETTALLLRARQLALDIEPAIAESIHEIIIGFLRDINLVAVKIAGVADGLIIAKILETHSGNRPVTGVMESHIRSEPGPLGLVEVGMIDELNKIVNPNGYGPFWRAQEYGTGSSEVPSQEGRVLFGTFEDSGTPPDASQRGRGEGHDIAFIPGGANPGQGIISVELPGRHFLRDGTAEAGVRYIKAMEDVQKKWNEEIRSVIARLRQVAAERQGTFTGILEA